MITQIDDFHIPLSELRKEWKNIKAWHKDNLLGDFTEMYLRWSVEVRRSHYWQQRALEAERKLVDVA